MQILMIKNKQKFKFNNNRVINIKIVVIAKQKKSISRLQIFEEFI